MKVVVLCFFAFFVVLAGCGGSEAELNKLRSENEQLRKDLKRAEAELDDLKNGASTLMAKAKNMVASGDLSGAISALVSIENKHKSAPEFREALVLKKQVQIKLQEENKRKEADALRAAAEQRKIAEASLRDLEKVRDKVMGITFYKVKGLDVLSTYIEAYIGVGDNGDHWLRQRLNYYADDWLFIRSYLVMVDGAKTEFGSADFERDHSSGSIWEWQDSSVSDSNYKLLEQIANSKETIIRFQGQQYYSDHTVTSIEKARIKKILAAYKTFSGVKVK